MNINLLKSYGGNAITRQYKRAKHLTYLGGVATGTTLGFSSLMTSADRMGWAFGLGALGLVLLKDSFDIYKTGDLYLISITLNTTRIPRKEANEFVKNNQPYYSDWLFAINSDIGSILYNLTLID